MTGDKVDATIHLRCREIGEKMGEMGNLSLQKGELAKVLHIAFSHKYGCLRFRETCSSEK